jgi:hypothetical protein
MGPAQGEGLTAVAVGEQAEVADLDEAGGQNVKQEAADELDCVEGHDCTTVVTIYLTGQRPLCYPFSYRDRAAYYL